MTFEELGVSQEIRQAIEELGFVSPMPVQEQVIPYLLGNNNDVVALAQTGTGKTAAYGLPVLQKISLNEGIEQTKYDEVHVQALVIAPTRELCLQISDDLKSYSKYIKGLHVLPVYGGASIETQIRALKKGVQVIVATPGRLVDLMKRGVAKLDRVENVVLDEADEMLSMGFSESIDAILEGVPENRNTLLFSATMSKEIDIDKCINEGNISAINHWNREHVWKYIGLYDGNEVMEKGLGVHHIDSTPHIDYLKKKYGEIYNL